MRGVLTQLVELYDSVATDFAEQNLAADLYVSLAGHFFDQQKDLIGIRFSRRALQLSPVHAIALLELSKAEEQRGKHEEALMLLESLHAMNMASAEARLRLALNMDRLFRREEATSELRRLLGTESPDWVRLLTFQELVRIEIESGKPQQAQDLLSKARVEFLEDCTLLIASMHAAERLGGTATAHLAREELSSCGRSGGQSARMRYARRSPVNVQPVRVEVERQAAQHLADLVAALQVVSGGPSQ